MATLGKSKKIYLLPLLQKAMDLFPTIASQLIITFILTENIRCLMS